MTNEELDAMRTLMVERNAALSDAQSVSPQRRCELEALKSRCSLLETDVFKLTTRNVQLEATLHRISRILEDWRAMPRNWEPTPLLALVEKALGKS
jgi:hypothetical protein